MACGLLWLGLLVVPSWHYLKSSGYAYSCYTENTDIFGDWKALAHGLSVFVAYTAILSSCTVSPNNDTK